jgi:hypothetical protein
MSGTPPWQRALALLFVLCTRLAGHMVIDGRPDLACGLAAAMAVLTPFRSRMVGSSWRHQLVIGAWCAAALLIKPTTFALTLLSTFMAWTLATWCDRAAYRRGEFFGPLARAWAICSVPVLALAMPYFVINRRHIFDYIFNVVAGSGRAVAELPTSRLFRLNYFLFGYAGGEILHNYMYILGALIAAGAIAVTIRAIVRREERTRFWRGLSLGLITLVTYLVPSLLGIKNLFFAMQFHILLVLGGVWVMRMFLVHGREWRMGWARYLSLTLGAAAGGIFWPFVGDGPDAPWATDYNRVIMEVTSAVLNNAQPHSRVFLTGAGWLNSYQLNYLSWKENKPIDATDEASSVLPKQIEGFDKADMVVAADFQVGEFFTYLPSTAVLDQSLAAIRRRRDFQLIARIPSETGGAFYIFDRPPVFGDWVTASDLGPDEGPFPQWNLPIVRWGLYPSVTLVVRALEAGTYHLRAAARAQVDGQEITVLADGQVAGRYRFTETIQFEDIDIPLSLGAGEHKVELDFAKSQTITPGRRPGGALFARLQFQPDNPSANAGPAH